MLKFFVVGLLVGLSLALNPLLTNLSFIKKSKNASQKEAPLFSSASQQKSTGENHQLPLAADVFLAVADRLPIFPIRNWNVEEIKIPAETALVFDNFYQEILFRKNDINHSYPIASLTKIMTALIVLENASLNEIFEVSRQAVDAYGEMGNLRVGEHLTVKNLLAALLIESSNDAAEALAENVNKKSGKNFVEMMNTQAENLKLKNTKFFDPAGLSPQNVSSAWDLNRLMREFVKQPVFQEITQTASIDIVSAEGYNHHLTSTNQLLGRLPEIIAGKTGYTEEAGECMALVVKSPDNRGELIFVVMNAQDRLAETAALVKWTKEAFIW